MALSADIVTLATLAAVSAAGNQGTALAGLTYDTPNNDFSGYHSGILVANITAAGTTLTPVFQISDDGTTWVTVPVGILAAPAAITTTGQFWYPFLPANLALPRYFRVSWTSVTGSFTGKFRAYMHA